MPDNDAAANLWAPWRIEYLRALDKPNEKGSDAACFICDYASRPEDDRQNLVLWRSASALVVFNRFPYTNGHLLIAPIRHIGSLTDVSDEEMLALMHLARDAQKVLDEVVHPQGYNLGVNFGRCAGAGLPEHLHLHLVPRWNGDTNYMSVLADVRVISQSLEALYDELKKAADRMNLPCC